MKIPVTCFHCEHVFDYDPDEDANQQDKRECPEDQFWKASPDSSFIARCPKCQSITIVILEK